MVVIADEGTHMSETKDAMGDRMKSYESATDQRLPRNLPIVARLDGKGFSKWTADLERPFDGRLHNVMSSTMRFLATKTHAKAAYTQSDEITLGWTNETKDSQVWFDGRVLKMASVLSAMASSYFNRQWASFMPFGVEERPLAFFDCRVWSVPNLDEAANTFLWREFDCTKNSISQATRHYYSHKQMMNKNGIEMKEMLILKGVNWQDYPNWAKYGTYVVRRVVERELSDDEMAKIPVEHRPTGPVPRSWYVTLSDSLRWCSNRPDVLFKGETMFKGSLDACPEEK